MFVVATPWWQIAPLELLGVAIAHKTSLSFFAMCNGFFD
jgi:hypothetical protein